MTLSCNNTKALRHQFCDHAKITLPNWQQLIIGPMLLFLNVDSE